ncbi:MAG: hypothetical protein A2V70_19590 [Planctomycetes bacterium RBG_13_63_9]|nr:MAG: hypothetical protein A2V70_19590 [Planctomycetes bacterium RBG_13_63_9]
MVTMEQIREVGLRIGEQFHPQRVVLFGSYADGTATEDSDVDLLVVVPFEGKAVEKSVEIRLKAVPPFPVDLLVYAPDAIQQRIAMGDAFLQDVLDHGKVLYEADHR